MPEETSTIQLLDGVEGAAPPIGESNLDSIFTIAIGVVALGVIAALVWRWRRGRQEEQ